MRLEVNNVRDIRNDEYIRDYHEFRLYRLILQLNILTPSCSSELISMFEPSTWQSHIYPKIENRSWATGVGRRSHKHIYIKQIKDISSYLHSYHV